MKFCHLSLALLAAAKLLGGSLPAAPLPVEQEVLGPWHYLLPLAPNDWPNNSRPMYPPTAVEFGEHRIATFLPGSDKVAEFKNGRFEELPLPSFASTCSLAADRQGKLYCLLQRRDRLKRKDGWRERWIMAWTNGVGWSQPIQIPFLDADHLAFDQKNRLWALGPAPVVAVFTDGHWDHYRYSNDVKLNFAPVRLADGADGMVILFSVWDEVLQTSLSHLPGALIYHAGQFKTEPQRDVGALRAEQHRRDEALTNDDFERAKGYLCRAEALNARRSGLVTVVRNDAHVLVSLGYDGLAWANTDALRAAPPFDQNAEWERIDDVAVPPIVAPDGTLWIVRDHPLRLVRVGRDGEQSFAMEEMPEGFRHYALELDQLGRPWVVGWRSDNPVAYLQEGRFKVAGSLLEALQAESSAFQPGRVFPASDHCVKTPAGAFCLLDYEDFTICDTEGIHSFTDEEISPGHTKRHRQPRHGYNPFRYGQPRFDALGRIYTAVDGDFFRYQAGRWRAVHLSVKDQAALLPAALPEETGYALGADETSLRTTLDGRRRLFRHLHFYERLADGHLEALDHGLNPLALYPFWSGWYGSPGMTTPEVDPTGRIWLSALGPYAENHVWLRQRLK